MDERLLLKIALSCSLAGLVALYFLTANLTPEQTKISNLTGIEESTMVRLRGVVESVDDNGNMMYLDIAQPETASIIVFKDRKLDIAKGDFVEVRGEVSNYKGKKEIVATGIDVLG